MSKLLACLLAVPLLLPAACAQPSTAVVARGDLPPLFAPDECYNWWILYHGIEPHPYDFNLECFPILPTVLCRGINCDGMSGLLETGLDLVFGLLCTAANCPTLNDAIYGTVNDVCGRVSCPPAA